MAAIVAREPPAAPASDSGLLLFDSLRLANGDAPYRDFETYASPGPLVLYAAVFRAAGASMQVALAVHALLQGLLAVLVFAIARRVGATPALALVAAALPLGVGYGIWPAISAHWFGAVGLAAVGLVFTWDWLAGGFGRNVLQGAAVGVLLWLQHQKGLLLLPVLAVWLAVDARLAPAAVRRPAALVRRLAAMTAGFAVAVAIGFAPILAVSGTWMVEGLLVGPLTRYGQSPINQTSTALAILRGVLGDPRHPLWGLYAGLLLLLALAIAAGVGFACAAWRTRGTPAAARRFAFVGWLVVSAEVTSSYRPLIPAYQALAVPALAVAAALGLTRLGERWRVPRRALRWGSGVVIAALLAHAWWGVHARARQVPYRAATAFGSIAMPTARSAASLERSLAAARRLGLTALYCHTYCPEANLLTGLPDPTRYDVLLRGYNPPEAFARTQAILARRRDPYIAVGWMASMDRDDPVLKWIHAHYEPARGALRGGFGHVGSVLVRRDLAVSQPAAPARAPGVLKPNAER